MKNDNDALRKEAQIFTEENTSLKIILAEEKQKYEAFETAYHKMATYFKEKKRKITYLFKHIKKAFSS